MAADTNVSIVPSQQSAASSRDPTSLLPAQAASAARLAADPNAERLGIASAPAAAADSLPAPNLLATAGSTSSRSTLRTHAAHVTLKV